MSCRLSGQKYADAIVLLIEYVNAILAGIKYVTQNTVMLNIRSVAG